MYDGTSIGRSRARVRGAFAATEHLATEAVVAFVDGELSMTAYQRAAAHLSICGDCVAEVDAQQRVRTAVRSAAPLTMPAGLRLMLTGIADTSRPEVEPESPVLPLPAAPPRGVDAGKAPGSRSGRPFHLGVLTVSVLAIGVLAATAAAPSGAEVAPSMPVPAAAVPAQGGAEVLPANTTPHMQLASFKLMFSGGTGAADLELVQTRTSP